MKKSSEDRYRKTVVDNIRKLSGVTLTDVCKGIGVRASNIYVEKGLTIERLEEVYDEYVKILLKEIILSQADMSNKRKIYYGGKNYNEQH